MNEAEALTLLNARLDAYRGRSYAELRRSVGQDAHVEVRGPSGAAYTVEVQVLWDAAPEGDIRVIGSIDDGGLRAFRPLCRDLLISPGGTSC